MGIPDFIQFYVSCYKSDFELVIKQLSILAIAFIFLKNRLILSYVLDIMFIEVIIMMIDTNVLVPMTDANQNFSKVVRMVDEDGMAVILKNNKPRYVVVDFDEYNTIAMAIQMRKAKIDSTADKIIEENMEAFLELGK